MQKSDRTLRGGPVDSWLERGERSLGGHELWSLFSSTSGGFDVSCARFLFGQAFQIVRVFGSHPAIPPGEIEAKITGPTLVMHIVMRDGGEPTKNWHPCPAAGEDFISTMRQGIFENHDRQDDVEREIVCGDDHQGQRDIHVFDHGFCSGEIIRREGRWIMRAVVLHMRALVEFCGVHGAVRPVEIGVMREK